METASTEFINEIIQSGQISEWIKRRGLIVLGKRDFRMVKFLEMENPVTYLYIAAEIKHSPEDKWIEEQIMKLTDENNLKIILSSVGKLRKFNLLRKIYKEYSSIKEVIETNYLSQQ
jgi:hypothetical protein